MTFLDVWVGYTIFGITAFSAFFIWAVRAKQFSDLDRARRIALDAAELPVGAKHRKPRPGFADRYTWVALVLLLVAAIIAALWIGN